MPHVVIQGNISTRKVWERFEPLERRRSEEILKVLHAWLDRQEKTVLLEIVTVSAGFRQQFFLQVCRKGDDAVTVRMEPMTDPEKTDAVRRAVALVARWILSLEPGLEISSSNIESFLEKEPAD